MPTQMKLKTFEPIIYALENFGKSNTVIFLILIDGFDRRKINSESHVPNYLYTIITIRNLLPFDYKSSKKKNII